MRNVEKREVRKATRTILRKKELTAMLVEGAGPEQDATENTSTTKRHGGGGENRY